MAGSVDRTLETPVLFDPRWLEPGGVVPVDPVTTGLLVREIIRLQAEVRLLWKANREGHRVYRT